LISVLQIFQSLKNYWKVKRRNNPANCPLLSAVLTRIKEFMKASSVTSKLSVQFAKIKPMKLVKLPRSKANEYIASHWTGQVGSPRAGLDDVVK
jgi:hypothetical protein